MRERERESARGGRQISIVTCVSSEEKKEKKKSNERRRKWKDGLKNAQNTKRTKEEGENRRGNTSREVHTTQKPRERARCCLQFYFVAVYLPVLHDSFILVFC